MAQVADTGWQRITQPGMCRVEFQRRITFDKKPTSSMIKRMCKTIDTPGGRWMNGYLEHPATYVFCTDYIDKDYYDIRRAPWDLPVIPENLQELVEDCGLDEATADTGWKAKNGYVRCITDFERRITYPEKLLPYQITALKQWLERDACPGWTGVGCQVAEEHDDGSVTYLVTTTMDST